jgi:hypothetical protein
MTLSNMLLRLVLLLGGAYIVFAATDFAAGGIISLGLIEPKLAPTIADVPGFDILASAIWFQRLRVTLLAITFMMFAGGVARFSTGHPDILFGPHVLGGLALEIIAMPILFYWIWHSEA